DAGASLIGLIATFLYFSDNPSFPYNFVLACTAEEEISGKNGIACILNDLPPIDFAIVGEPTEMHLAVAEKGLIVLDCYAYGKAGHAARNEGENAIYKAIADIEWFRTYQFERVSEMLGCVKMTVTQIEAGKQHNVVPDVCHFVVDVRTTDAYTNEETLDIIRASVRSEVKPRSLRLQPSSIPLSHPFVRAGVKFGRRCFGSPTLSDQALLPCPSVKIGIGDSARSHMANEFVCVREIEDGIALYIALLEEVGRMV
ncbi:MAG: M20/M25/M40 family metallo-hydrolase, partial [Flammeovirgaceae bacterium]|nr:M20/M25/M40 family metallo-hydrolase [Flammeovirgaceae bacterium]